MAFLRNFCPLLNVARFARTVEWDFFRDFQTPWVTMDTSSFIWDTIIIFVQVYYILKDLDYPLI